MRGIVLPAFFAVLPALTRACYNQIRPCSGQAMQTGTLANIIACEKGGRPYTRVPTMWEGDGLGIDGVDGAPVVYDYTRGSVAAGNFSGHWICRGVNNVEADLEQFINCVKTQKISDKYGHFAMLIKCHFDNSEIPNGAHESQRMGVQTYDIDISKKYDDYEGVEKVMVKIESNYPLHSVRRPRCTKDGVCDSDEYSEYHGAIQKGSEQVVELSNNYGNDVSTPSWGLTSHRTSWNRVNFSEGNGPKFYNGGVNSYGELGPELLDDGEFVRDGNTLIVQYNKMRITHTLVNLSAFDEYWPRYHNRHKISTEMRVVASHPSCGQVTRTFEPGMACDAAYIAISAHGVRKMCGPSPNLHTWYIKNHDNGYSCGSIYVNDNGLG